MDNFERQSDIDVPSIGLPPSAMRNRESLGPEPSGALRTSAPPVIAAYLGDPCAVFGADAIVDQKRAVDAYVATRLQGRSIDRFFVDSGRLDGPPAPGVAIAALLAHGRAKGFDILVVECIARLAPTLDLAFAVLATLWRLGIEVHEVSGVVPLDPALIARAYGGCRASGAAGQRVSGGAASRAPVAGDGGF